MQKQISTIWGIVVIIAAVVVAFGGIFAYQQHENSQIPNTKKLNSEILAWKILDYDHYEFKYPSAWNVWVTLESSVPAGCFAQGDSVCTYFYGGAFSVNVLPWNENTCKQYWNGVGGPRANLQETKTIDGKQFYYGRFEEDNLEIYHIFYNKSCYELAATIIGKPDLDKILSTFKFTK